MGDTTRSADAAGSAGQDDKREPIPRPLYISLRLKELAAELQAMVTERQNLNTSLKEKATEAGKADGSKEVRKMRERRGYLAIRINVLRAEQQSLASEKEALPPVTTPQGAKKPAGAKKKAKPAA